MSYDIEPKANKNWWHRSFNWARRVLGEELLRTILQTSWPTLSGFLFFSFRPIQEYLLGLLPPTLSRESLLLLLPIFGLVLSIFLWHRIALVRKIKMRETEIVLLEQRLKNQAEMIESLTRFDEIEYDFDQKNGYYTRIKSPYVFCPRCYHNKRESPMKVLKNGWQCLHPECGYFLENSDYDPFSFVSDARW